jgi:DNA-binding XRE family transcriptional regulator
MTFNRSRRIYMDRATIEHGIECSDCLRWHVPVFTKNDPCPHCKRQGVPPYPNRVRYLTVKNGYSLRMLAREANLEWRTVRLISQGRRAPHLRTKRKILKALGVSTKKTEMRYVFPHDRRRQK